MLSAALLRLGLRWRSTRRPLAPAAAGPAAPHALESRCAGGRDRAAPGALAAFGAGCAGIALLLAHHKLAELAGRIALESHGRGFDEHLRHVGEIRIELELALRIRVDAFGVGIALLASSAFGARFAGWSHRRRCDERDPARRARLGSGRRRRGRGARVERGRGAGSANTSWNFTSFASGSA